MRVQEERFLTLVDATHGLSVPVALSLDSTLVCSWPFGCRRAKRSFGTAVSRRSPPVVPLRRIDSAGRPPSLYPHHLPHDTRRPIAAARPPMGERRRPPPPSGADTPSGGSHQVQMFIAGTRCVLMLSFAYWFAPSVFHFFALPVAIGSPSFFLLFFALCFFFFFLLLFSLFFDFWGFHPPMLSCWGGSGF